METFSSDVHKILIQQCRNITRETDKEKICPFGCNFVSAFLKVLEVNATPEHL